MVNSNKMVELIDRMVATLVEMKQVLTSDVAAPTSTPSVRSVAPVVQAQSLPPLQTAVPMTSNEDLATFDSLRKALESDKWPEAVNPHLICDPNSDEEAMERGRGIVELMIEDELKDLRVLDFGCGNGHVPFLATQYGAAVAVGYDVKSSNRWGNYEYRDNLLFTTNFEEVKQHGPYNVIVMFDVLDHVEGETSQEVLKKAASVLAENGKIYMRVHPWVSRHGTHLYHDMNKAYMHLVFSESELRQIIPHSDHEVSSVGVIYPLKTYGDLITNAGLKVQTHREITQKVDAFFKIPKVAERIMRHTRTEKFPEFQMSMEFIDYKLSK